MKGKNQFLVWSIVAGLFMSTAANADQIQTDKQKIQDLQSSLDSVHQQIDQAQQKKDQLDSQVSQLQQSIDLVKQKIDQNQQAIDAKTTEVQNLDNQIQQNQAQLSKLQNIFNEQIRALYEHGDISYLSVLMSANSFDDFLSRFDDIRLIATENDKLMQQIKTLKQQLATQKQQVQSDLAAAQQKQQEMAVLAQTYQTMQQQQQQQADAQQSQINADQNKSSQIQSEIDFAKQELQYAESKPIAETGPSIPANENVVAFNGSTNQIVSYAEQFMGTPYVWGGTQPGGFDCSGFTQYVFGHFGIPLSRTSQSQFTQGISVSNLQPGDLVFFSTYAPGATHVGIYIGSGLMVNAEDNGVRVDDIHNPYYWGPRFIGARRIVN